VNADERARYEKRIVELNDALASVTASGVANATRYAADLAAEKRAGAERVARIREAIAAGAHTATQATAIGYALHSIEDGEIERLDPRAWALCQARESGPTRAAMARAAASRSLSTST
jgi:hypothetical protein